MPVSESQTLVRRVRSDVGDNAPAFGDDIAWGILGGKGSSTYILEIFALDDSLPTDGANSGVASGETVKVPIGSIWTAVGSNATNKQYMKTAASTWTKISAV